MTLAASYAHSREIARTRARNFYYAFRLLDAERRDSLSAVYAFMRYCDDLSDEPGATVEALERWRGELAEALAGRPSGHPLWPGFLDTVERYSIPHSYFHDHIDGVASDLQRTSIGSFDELYFYCYQVASIAGLCLVHIFGPRSDQALRLAEKCGIAFQLTNIIRDVEEDAGLGRVYLPREDLQRFQVDPACFRTNVEPPALRELLRFEACRARAYFDEAMPLLDMVTPSCRPALEALIEIYSRLLERIEQRDYNVLRERVRLSTLEKTWLLVRALPRAWMARWKS